MARESLNTLSSFLSQIKGKTFAFNRPYLFEVMFNLSQVAADPSVPRLFSLLCHQCNLPGWSAQTQAIKIYGLEYEMPHGLQYDQLQMSFYVDNSYKVMRVFDSLKQQYFNNVDYSPEYASTYRENSSVIINIFDTGNEIDVAQYEFKNAMVKTVNSVVLDWSATNQVQQVTVVVTFDTMEVKISGAEGQFNEPQASKPMNVLSSVSSGQSNVMTPMNFDTIRSLNPLQAASFLSSRGSPLSQLTSGATNIVSGIGSTVSNVAGQFANKVGNLASGNVNINNGILDNVRRFIS